MRPEDVPAKWVEKAARTYMPGAFNGEVEKHYPNSPDLPEIKRQQARDHVRPILAAALPEIQAQALREAADEMEAEYEERTAKSGAYGQTKIRAALLMGAGMVRSRATRLTTPNEEPS